MEDILYETVFKRKSIRKFNQNPLKEDVLDDIKEFLDNLEPLFPEIETELKIISSNDLNLLTMKKAPHYLAIFSKNVDNYQINVGYLLEQFDLYLSSKGLGSCWQGIPRPKKDLVNSSKLEYMIVIAFGEADEKIQRDDISEFNRKELNEITTINESKELLELARLAPSSRNRQPWYFTGTKELINIFCINSLLTRLFVKKMTLIDIGIAIYHIKLAALKLNKDIKVLNLDKDDIKGYVYIFSLEIK